MMKYIMILYLFLFLLILSCSQGYIINRDEKTEFPWGRELFAAKCSGCHKLPYPIQFTNSEWDSILIPMQMKAKITDQERLQISKWLTERRINEISNRNN